MHVKPRIVALAGLLTAFVAILLELSSVIESNSLFLIAAASFCVGIVIREWGIWSGMSFLVASFILCLLITPNKFYCITYAVMGVYLVMSELLWRWIAGKQGIKRQEMLFWLGRYVLFNCVYIPAVLFFQEILFSKSVSDMLLLGCILAGQIVLLIYEKAYVYFQAMVWGRLRNKLL